MLKPVFLTKYTPYRPGRTLNEEFVIMPTSRFLGVSLAAVSLVSLSACVTDPNTGERKVSRTAIGGVGGAVLGGLLGGVIGGRTGRIIGAGLGGIGGAVVGNQMDKQIKELKEQTAGSGIDVSSTDNGQAILVNLPDGVTFATNSSVVSPAFRSTLDQIAQSLRDYPNSLVDVYGYTDSTGSDSFNQALSERRAKAVSDYLNSRGIASSRMRWQGFGETGAIASNDTIDGRAKNRRVEIKIVPITQEDVAAARGGR